MLGVALQQALGSDLVITATTTKRKVSNDPMLDSHERALFDGAPDILSVALDAGYGSHEAFTCAFRQHFGLTLEQARAQRPTINLNLLSASPERTATYKELGALPNNSSQLSLHRFRSKKGLARGRLFEQAEA
jgi:hypothetical protein